MSKVKFNINGNDVYLNDEFDENKTGIVINQEKLEDTLEFHPLNLEDDTVEIKIGEEDV